MFVLTTVTRDCKNGDLYVSVIRALSALRMGFHCDSGAGS